MAQYKLDFFRYKALELAATKVLATNSATDTDSSSLGIAILVIAHIHLTMSSKTRNVFTRMVEILSSADAFVHNCKNH